MIRFWGFSLLLFLAFQASAQKLRHEFGLFVGSSYYLGDINHLKPFYSPGADYGILHRYTFNKHFALKTQIGRMALSADDNDFSSVYQQKRNHSFSTHLIEFVSMGEFNFLPYNPPARLNFTPYVTAGFGVALADNLQYSNFYTVIPIGAGFKTALSKRLTLSASWVFRNAMSDLLDDLPPTVPSLNLDLYANKQLTQSSTNDWYSVLDISISYNFASTKKWCPAYLKSSKKK